MHEKEWHRNGNGNGKGKYYSTWLAETPSIESRSYCGATKLLDRKRSSSRKKCYSSNKTNLSVNQNLNLQDQGEGRYISSNGDECQESETRSGRGTLIWNNGDKYDGVWENGEPRGSGVFTWTDGSYYVGNWLRDGMNGQHQLDGMYYSGIGVPRGLDDGALFSGESFSRMETNKGFPRICVWESDGEDGDITCEVIDDSDDTAAAAALSYLDGKKSGNGSEFMYFSPYCFKDEVKKPGEIIRRAHKNYSLMLSLQQGVRYSVAKIALDYRKLHLSDFSPKEKFWTKFPLEGFSTSGIQFPHRPMEFRWKDYCPLVFRHLRELFQVDPADYLLSICGKGGLRELSSPGKSGSLFYITLDDRFIIKTVKKSEVKVLIKMLQSYYQHVSRHPNSLITKFVGVYCVKPIGGSKTRFIVMGNLFCSEYAIHERYDLKGSSYGRRTNKPERDIDETTTRKDLDLNLVFHLSRHWFQELLKQIDIDCKFLEAEGIMDYSLLVGLHFCNDNIAQKMGVLSNQIHSGKSELYEIEKFLSGCNFLEAEFENVKRANCNRKPPTRLGVNMPARAERKTTGRESDQYSPGGITNYAPFRGESYNVILQFGIIDILQDYDISKKLEHAYKSFQADPSSISAVDPKLYSRRFQNFIGRVFAKDT